MLVALWIVTGLLAAANLAAGLGKITTPWDRLTQRMAWTQDVGPARTRTAGWAEIVGAAGLVVPNLLAHGVAGWDWARWVAVAAAAGLALVQVLAIVTVHVPRKDPIAANLGFVVLSVAAAVLTALA